jgi:hypothetical protein
LYKKNAYKKKVSGLGLLICFLEVLGVPHCGAHFQQRRRRVEPLLLSLDRLLL